MQFWIHGGASPGQTQDSVTFWRDFVDSGIQVPVLSEYARNVGGGLSVMAKRIQNGYVTMEDIEDFAA